MADYFLCLSKLVNFELCCEEMYYKTNEICLLHILRKMKKNTGYREKKP